jgi:hypothetical protein
MAIPHAEAKIQIALAEQIELMIAKTREALRHP